MTLRARSSRPGRAAKGLSAVGDRVYGVKPISRDGSHASHLLVKGRLRAESAAGPKHSGPGGAAVFLRDDLARREGGWANSRQHVGKDCPRDGPARQGDQAKKGGCGRFFRGGAALHMGFVQAGSGKHLPKWLGSSSNDGSISRLGLRRRFATSMPPLIMLDVAGLDGACDSMISGRSRGRAETYHRK